MDSSDRNRLFGLLVVAGDPAEFDTGADACLSVFHGEIIDA